MNKFEMKQLAYQSSLKNRALQVLVYLIDRANKEQTCFPAVSTIGRELHISVSTVKRAMRELVEAGYVTKESRFRQGNRGQTSNLYTLFFAGNRIGEERVDTEDCQSEHPASMCQEKDKGAKKIEKLIYVKNDDSLYSTVNGGGGQNGTALNIQFNQELKSEKEVFYRKRIFIDYLRRMKSKILDVKDFFIDIWKRRLGVVAGIFCNTCGSKYIWNQCSQQFCLKKFYVNTE